MKFIQDRHGKLAVWQEPNLPLKVWAGAMILGWLWPIGTAKNLLHLISFGSLFAWSYLEITSGSSTYRRVLGSTVLLYILYSNLP